MTDMDTAVRHALLVDLYRRLGVEAGDALLEGVLTDTADIGLERLKRGVVHLRKTWDEARPPRAGDIRTAVKVTSMVGVYAGASSEQPQERRLLASGEPVEVGDTINALLGTQERTREGRERTAEMLREMIMEDAHLPHRVAFYRKRLDQLGAEQPPEPEPGHTGGPEPVTVHEQGFEQLLRVWGIAADWRWAAEDFKHIPWPILESHLHRLVFDWKKAGVQFGGPAYTDIYQHLVMALEEQAAKAQRRAS